MSGASFSSASSCCAAAAQELTTLHNASYVLTKSATSPSGTITYEFAMGGLQGGVFVYPAVTIFIRFDCTTGNMTVFQFVAESRPNAGCVGINFWLPNNQQIAGWYNLKTQQNGANQGTLGTVPFCGPNVNGQWTIS